MINLTSKVYVVMDTMVYVRALAGLPEENDAWGAMIRICHSLVVSDKMEEQYRRVITEYGCPGYIVIHRGVELNIRNKIKRLGNEDLEGIEVNVEISHKDLPFIKAAIASKAAYLITEDEDHFLSKKQEIQERHNITVVRPSKYCDICNSLNRN